MLSLFLALQETAEMSSKEAVPFLFPSVMNESSCCSASLSGLGITIFVVVVVAVF